jgi:glutathione synthase
MKLAFVVDPLDKLKAYKDSSIALMREAAKRGHEVSALEARDMFVRDGAVTAECAASKFARTTTIGTAPGSRTRRRSGSSTAC